MTITEFLLARIAEDEAVAQRAASFGADFIGYDTGDRSDAWRGEAGPYDPTRVLAECEAKRRIVEQLQRHERLVIANSEKQTEASCGGLANQEQITALRTHGWELSGRLEALRMAADSLVAVHADHPDYDEAWAL